MTGQQPATDRAHRLARRRPRLGRLLAAVDVAQAELAVLRDRPAATSAEHWPEVAERQLMLARLAVAQRRIDDGWDLLHAARQQSMNAYTVEEVRATAAALWRECDTKLSDWRRRSALAELTRVDELVGATGQDTGSADPDPQPVAPAAVNGATLQAARVRLAAAQRLLDESSHHTYLRLRYLGQRLVAAASCLVVVLALLAALAERGALAGSRFGADTLLADGESYLTVVLLGVLGALLSFAIGTMHGSGPRRIYELATARFAAVAARLMVGAAAAVVVCLAIQSGVVDLGEGVAAILSVTAGFSERLVRRILESLSDSAEQPAEPTPRPADPAPPARSVGPAPAVASVPSPADPVDPLPSRVDALTG